MVGLRSSSWQAVFLALLCACNVIVVGDEVAVAIVLAFVGDSVTIRRQLIERSPITDVT